MVMQLLNSSEVNRLFFTATEFYSQGDTLYLNIHHISTNNDFFYSFAKTSDLSFQLSRYNAFDVSIGNIPGGQCTYTLYEGESGATGPEDAEVLSVLECGLYQIIESETNDTVFSANTIEYIEPNL
jgi:hypothetical protein